VGEDSGAENLLKENALNDQAVIYLVRRIDRLPGQELERRDRWQYGAISLRRILECSKLGRSYGCPSGYRIRFQMILNAGEKINKEEKSGKEAVLLSLRSASAQPQ
jgi:hypothetical protein